MHSAGTDGEPMLANQPCRLDNRAAKLLSSHGYSTSMADGVDLPLLGKFNDLAWLTPQKRPVVFQRVLPGLSNRLGGH